VDGDPQADGWWSKAQEAMTAATAAATSAAAGLSAMAPTAKPSCSAAVARHLGGPATAPVIVSGPTTATAAEQLGFTVGAVAESPAPAALAAAVAAVIAS